MNIIAPFMNSSKFDDPITFRVVPSMGQNFNFSSTLVYKKISQQLFVFSSN